MIFAYSPFVRALIWLPYRYLIIFVVTRAWLYEKVYLSHDWRTASFRKKVEMKVRKLKADVKVKKREGIVKRWKLEKDKWETMKEEAKKQEDGEESLVDSPPGNEAQGLQSTTNGRVAIPIQDGPGASTLTVIEEGRPSSQHRPRSLNEDLEAQTRASR